MTMVKPRIGFRNIFHDAPEVSASSSQDGYGPESAVNWGIGHWKPEASRNLLTNGSFLAWTLSEPDDWTKAGAGATWAQDTAHDAVPPYSLALTRSGADASAYQDIAADGSYAGRKIAVGFHVTASSASQAKITIDDGVGTTSSDFHAGAGADEWLTVARTLDAAATRCRVTLEVVTSDGTVYFDGGLAIEGPVAELEETPSRPETAYLYCYPLDTVNRVRNWFFRDWSDGGADPPDSWDESTAGAVSLSSDAQIGMYALRLTGNAGGARYAEQGLSAQDVAELVGRYLRLGAWVKTATATFASISIVVTLSDGTATVTASSSDNDGDGDADWEVTDRKSVV
jgi:hypothetical protein